MAEYQVMYWKEIPAQVRARDTAGGEARKLLSERFQLAIDTVAQAQGLAGTDDYLEHWHWGPRLQREGSAQEVAEAVAAEIEASFFRGRQAP